MFVRLYHETLFSKHLYTNQNVHALCPLRAVFFIYLPLGFLWCSVIVALVSAVYKPDIKSLPYDYLHFFIYFHPWHGRNWFHLLRVNPLIGFSSKRFSIPFMCSIVSTSTIKPACQSINPSRSTLMYGLQVILHCNAIQCIVLHCRAFLLRPLIVQWFIKECLS